MTTDQQRLEDQTYESVVLFGTFIKDMRAWLINRLAKEVRELRQGKDEALQVIVNTQQLAGCDGLDVVIERAKTYPELCRVIHQCVRLTDLMNAGYTVDSGNALLAQCEKDAGDHDSHA